MTAEHTTDVLCHCPTCTAHRERQHDPLRQRIQVLAVERQELAARQEVLMAGMAHAVRDAHDAGWSEYEIARSTGLSRMTVRKWLGKGRG